MGSRALYLFSKTVYIRKEIFLRDAQNGTDTITLLNTETIEFAEYRLRAVRSVSMVTSLGRKKALYNSAACNVRRHEDEQRGNT